MIFKETPIKDAYVIDIERHEDERGFFAREYCKKEFKDQHIPFEVVQANIAFNRQKYTLRGLHYQLEPYAEQKLVQCISGKIYDVILDIRQDSPTYHKWLGVELTQENRTMLYIPQGCAHGYQTLVKDSELFYMTSAFYQPDAERGVRWNDPAFDIKWKKTSDLIISDKDQQWPDYSTQESVI